MNIKFYKHVFLKYNRTYQKKLKKIKLSREDILKLYKIPENESKDVFQLIKKHFGFDESEVKPLIEKLIIQGHSYDVFGSDELFHACLNNDYEFYKISQLLEGIKTDQIENISFNIKVDWGPEESKETITIQSTTIMHRLLLLFHSFPKGKSTKRSKGRVKNTVKHLHISNCMLSCDYFLGYDKVVEFVDIDKYFFYGLILSLTGRFPTPGSFKDDIVDYRIYINDQMKYYNTPLKT